MSCRTEGAETLEEANKRELKGEFYSLCPLVKPKTTLDSYSRSELFSTNFSCEDNSAGAVVSADDTLIYSISEANEESLVKLFPYMPAGSLTISEGQGSEKDEEQQVGSEQVSFEVEEALKISVPFFDSFKSSLSDLQNSKFEIKRSPTVYWSEGDSGEGRNTCCSCWLF